MADLQRNTELLRHLTTAGVAHSEYEEMELHGVYDTVWAEWYARYLIAHGWNELFVHKWTEAELADHLHRAELAHREGDPSRPWQAFYAEYFVTVE